MKQLFTFFLLFVLSTGAFAQKKPHSDYENDSRWFLGVNAGALWHTTDVKNKTKMGWGFMLGRSFLYNYGKPISLDVRARFLRGLWVGQDDKFTNIQASDNAYNGTYGTYTNYLDSASGKVIRNFQADVYDASIELAMHINALRERTGIDFYIFGGIGLTWWQTYGNLFRGDTIVKTMYNYSVNSSHSQSAMKSLLDNSYDTPLEGSQKGKFNLSVMPSIGFGIGYQLTPYVQIGVEHRTTFTRADIFDGKSYNDDFSVSKSKDIYHYTGLYLKVNLKKIRRHVYDTSEVQNPYENSTNTNNSNHSSSNPVVTPPVNPPVVTPPCLAPSVSILNPRSNFSTSTDRFEVAALLNNIQSREQIVFKQNGVVNSNYTFNPSTGQFTANLVLITGQNIIEIALANACGNVSDSRLITLEREQLAPPVISYIHPSSSPTTVSTERYPLIANILNIQQANQIKLTVNGESFNAFTFQSSTHELTANIGLVEGANTIDVIATNAAGLDEKSTILIYRIPVELLAPVVQILHPGNSPTTVYQNSFPITATVLNVADKSGIFVTINGIANNGFNFDKNSKLVTFTANQLIFGSNTVSIKGVNTVGQDMKSTTIIYQREQVKLPPVVQFIFPSSGSYNSLNSSISVQVLVRNVLDKQHVDLKINGVSTENFLYNASAQTISFQTSLLNGANVIEVKGSNNDGVDEATCTILYHQPNLTKPPVVNIVSPASNPFTSFGANMQIVATVQNITHHSEMGVSVNENNLDFVFDSINNRVSFMAQLNIGYNDVKIVATNSAGSSSDSVKIAYGQRSAVQPPTLTFTQPTQNGTSVEIPAYTFSAVISNAPTKDNLNVKFNGVDLAQANYGYTNGLFTYASSLLEGNNVLEIVVSNVAGTIAGNRTITYVKKEIPCIQPNLSWLNFPEGNFETTDSILELKVQTQNVQANELICKLNGQDAGTVVFDVSTQTASKKLRLSEGMNVIQLMARNACGYKLITKNVRYTLPQAPCIVPVVNLMKPNISTFQTQASQVDLYVSTVNISSHEQIVVKTNGHPQDFSFDSVMHVLSFSPNLIEGANDIKVYVSNDCGSSSLTYTITRIVCQKPAFELTNGTSVNDTTSNPHFSISGLISNISSSEQIIVKLNGNPSNFIFDPNTGSFSASLFLTKGLNKLEIALKSACGNILHQASKTFIPPVVVRAPIVQITAPSVSPTTSLIGSVQVQALVQNVSSQNEISVKVNGNAVGFSFVNQQLNFVATLNIGSNSIVVSATNAAGTDADTKTVNFTQKEIVLAPIVEITSPRLSSETVESSTFTVQGVVKNISQENELQIRVNGQMITNYSFVKSAGQIAFSFPLNFDNFRTKFTVEVLASNEAGSGQDECTLSKKISSPVLPNTGEVKPPVIIGHPILPDTRKDTDNPSGTNSNTTKPTIETRPTSTIIRPTGMR